MNKNMGWNGPKYKNRIKSTGARITWQAAPVLGLAISAVSLAAPAHAVDLYDGSASGNNLEINLTTTLSYAGFYRVNSPSTILAGPGDANSNDGDANFRHGIVGNQVEILPVLDLQDGNFGAHFSGEAFLNTVYLQKNQNNEASTFNSVFDSSNRSFTSATRNVNGENAKLLDAFIYGQHSFSDGETLQVKIGRQTLFWGQSLLFANNGISAGQAPIDIVTAQATPNPEAQQVFLPVGQVVVTYRPNIGGLTIQGYYQFEWAHDSFDGAGSYFNGADYLDKGAQSVIVAPLAAIGIPEPGNAVFLRGKDLDPEHENGQFGLSVQDEFDEYDVGLYALRWDSKAPSAYAFPGVGEGPVPGGFAIGQYRLVYPRDIQTYGASVSTNVGAANVAGEISGRRNMPLLPAGFGIPSPGNPGNASSDPLYPVGNVLYAQASAIYASPGVPLDPGGISFTGEVAMNHLISVAQNRAALRPNGQATAAAAELIITPTYYDVLPGLNVTVPIGINYNFLGRSEVDQTMQHGTGSFNIGVVGTYRTVYVASLTYQDYLGKPSLIADNTTYNTAVDRGYVSLNLQYSF